MLVLIFSLHPHKIISMSLPRLPEVQKMASLVHLYYMKKRKRKAVCVQQTKLLHVGAFIKVTRRLMIKALITKIVNKCP